MKRILASFLFLFVSSAFASGTTVISTCEQFIGINNNLGGDYVLSGHLDCTYTGNNIMIGDGGSPFTGTFDGSGFTITINVDSGTSYGIALFRFTYGATIQNIGVLGSVSVVGIDDVALLIGYAQNTTILNSYASGTVSGNDYVGGLVGEAWDTTTISNSYAQGTVSGNDDVGGLVGFAYDTDISNSYAQGTVSGNDYVGGLVGFAYDTDISNSYAQATISGNDDVGGLVGEAGDSTISNSYAQATISGNDDVGGLVGHSLFFSTISNSYALSDVTVNSEHVGGLVGYASDTDISNSYAQGTVSGNDYVGGLVAEASNSTISNSYAQATISGDDDVGGLVGYNDSSVITSSYWDIDTYTGDNGLGSGLTSAQLQNVAFLSSAGWDIQINLTNNLNNGYPFLSWQVGDTSPVWYVYGNTYTGTPIGSCQDFININNNLGGNYYLTGDLDCILDGNAIMLGTYNSQFSGTLDGNGHTIQISLNFTNDTSSVALVSYTSGATISNLTVSGTIFVNSPGGGGTVAGVVGTNRGGHTVLHNVHFIGSIHNQSQNSGAGGLVGSISGSMSLENVSFYGILTGKSIGGIVASAFGATNLVISGASVAGSLSTFGSSSRIGGILLSTSSNSGNNFAIYNSVVSATLSGGSGTIIGGLVGNANCVYNQAYRDTNVLNNGNIWPDGLQAFGNTCGGGGNSGGGNQGGGNQGGGNQGGGSSGGGGGGGYRWIDTSTSTAPAPVVPKLKLHTIEKKTPQQFCGNSDHLSSGPRFGDVVGTRYNDAVNVLVQHCLVDGYNNEGREFGVNNPLTAGQMFKVFAKMSLIPIDKSVTGMGWSYGYKTAGDSIGLWNAIGNLNQNDPVTQSELLQVAFNYMQYMGLIDTVPTFSQSNKSITRGEFARFINVVLELVSTR